MGIEYWNPIKPPRYDITMSKRTRKTPSNLDKAVSQCPLMLCFPDRENSHKVAVHAEEETGEKSFEFVVNEGGGEQGSDHHKSLKALIGARSSLGQHFTEEKEQLQLVVRQPKDAGFEIKKIAARCAKILTRLIKIKRDTNFGSQKKRALRLGM